MQFPYAFLPKKIKHDKRRLSAVLVVPLRVSVGPAFAVLITDGYFSFQRSIRCNKRVCLR